MDVAARSYLYIQKVDEQIAFAQADIRSFIYLRTQSAFWAGTHGLGGGNFAMALCSFSLLSTLAKCFRAVTRPKKFVLLADDRRQLKCAASGAKCVRLHETNESAAFSAYSEWLAANGVNLGIVDGDMAARVWNGYRNWLVHRFDTRHLIVTFRYAESVTTSQDAEVVLLAAIERGETPLVRLPDGRFEFRPDLFYALLGAVRKSMSELLSRPQSAEAEEVLDDLLLDQESRGTP